MLDVRERLKAISEKHEKVLGLFLYWFLVLCIIPFLMIPFTGFKLLTISTTVVILLVTVLLIHLKETGRTWLSGLFFVLLLNFIGVILIYFDSVANLYAITVLILSAFIAGILFGPRMAVFIYVFQFITIIILTFLQLQGVVKVDVFKEQTLTMLTALVLAGLIGIAVIGSWLSNRELEGALERAIKSEEETKKYAKALEKQKGLLEIKVKERTKKLEESQKRRLEEIKNFANIGKISSGLIHDINNPLTVGLARIEELEETSPKSSEESLLSLKTVLEKIQTLALNTKKQILKQHEKTVFNMVEEAQAVLDLVSYKAVKEGVKVKVNAPAKITKVGDPVKFSQIILNLVLNSIDAFEKVRDGRSKLVEINLSKDKKDIILEVRDNGFGIPKKFQEKIFDPLFTTKTTKNGTGLGLYITCEYVKTFGGQIELTSKVGKGTSFKILFPVKSKR